MTAETKQQYFMRRFGVEAVQLRPDGIVVLDLRRVQGDVATKQMTSASMTTEPPPRPIASATLVIQPSACNDNELPGRYARAKEAIEQLGDEDLLGDLTVCEAILKTPASPCYQRSHMRELVRKFEQFTTKQRDPDSERDAIHPTGTTALEF